MAEVGFIPKKVAERGEAIYCDKYQREFEANFRGQFVMIDVKTEEAYRGNTPEEAYENARRQSAKGPFHLIKVGAAGAYKLSNAINGDRDWIFR
jgi:hypothetical protein